MQIRIAAQPVQGNIYIPFPIQSKGVKVPAIAPSHKVIVRLATEAETSQISRIAPVVTGIVWG
jgi:hypothetical protein